MERPQYKKFKQTLSFQSLLRETMNTYQWMQPITDTDTLIEYHEQISRVMLGIYSEQLLFIKQKGWVASLAFNDFRGDENYKERFIRPLARYGYSEFNALYWEVFKNEPPGFAIPATLAGVQECILKLVPGSLCVLFAGQPDWLIFLTRLNYMVIAGAPDFVTEVLGCSVETGFESLQDYLTSHEDRLIPEEKIYFKHLFHQFQQVYPFAVPGELINIGWLPLDESD